MPETPYERRAAHGRGQRGQLVSLSDGRTLARYRENGRGGKRPQRTFATRREASSWLRDRLDELDAVRDGDTALLTRERKSAMTVEQMILDYLATHDADPATIRKLTAQLRKAIATFGPRLASSVEPFELQQWRKTLSAGSAHDVFRALAQVYRQALAWDWLERNPCDKVQNRRPKRVEVQIPPWEAILAIADEIDERYSAAPFVLAGAGLRIEEYLALERGDLDLDERVLHVRRVYSSGRMVELADDGVKSWRQRRNVPLRSLVVDALQAMATRIDTRLLFPAPEGGYLRSENFRTRVWEPACIAAGVDYFPAKNLRHVYASESLDAGIPTLTLSRRMGTSLAQIDATYGHLVPDAAEVELRLLDAYDVSRDERRKAALNR